MDDLPEASASKEDSIPVSADRENETSFESCQLMEDEWENFVWKGLERLKCSFVRMRVADLTLERRSECLIEVYRHC